MNTDQKDILNECIESLRTKGEADHFCIQLDTLSESLYSKKININEKIEELFSTDMRNILVKSLKKLDIKMTDVIKIQKFVTDIREQIKQTAVIHITLSFRPKQSTIQRIYTWISFNLKIPIFIDIKLDPQIIGGAIIEYKGKYLDYTIRSIINERIKT